MPDTSSGEKPRACTNCSRAKAKCVRDDTDADACQRCLKNNLTCSKSDSVSTKRRGKATHAKVLEKKLDDIMSFLVRERGQEQSSHSEGPVQRPSFPSESPASTGIQTPCQEPAPSDSSVISVVPGFEVSFSEADQVLQEYMTTMLPEFPFVPLPFASSLDMLKDSPLLLKVILWVCRPPKPEVSENFENWFRQHIAHEVVVQMNKSLELVQAILVFLAWNDIYFYATAKDTALVQLAMCLIDDMKLTHPRWKEGSSFESIVEDAAHMQDNLPRQPNQTAAASRTLMGVYYITSSLCSLLGRRYRLEYYAHFDEYCDQLRQDEEYSTDSLLVNLVGIRRIAMKVNSSFWEMMGDSNNRPSGGVYSIAVASIQNELNAFMNQLPGNLKGNHLLRTHCASIRIRLFEPFRFGDKSQTTGSTHLRSRTIWDCLQSTHELYDAFRLVPVESFPSLTVISILHIALAIIKASRLLCVEDPAWDLNTARTMYNFPGILQQLSKVFEDASSAESPRSRMIVHGLPIFSEYAEAYRGIERLYLNRLNANVVVSNPYLMDPINLSSGDEGLEFWSQLSDFTNGMFP